MGQNVIAGLSRACLKSSRAGSFNDAVSNQQGTCAPSCSGASPLKLLGVQLRLLLQRVLGNEGYLIGIGSAMAQMPTRPPSVLFISLASKSEVEK